MAKQINAVQNIVSAFAETWNRHDMQAFSELYAEDAEFVNVVGLWWKGRAQIRAAHEFTHQNLFRHSRLSIDKTAIRFPTPTIAIARCKWTLENHRTPEGIVLPARKGILVHVLARNATDWRIIDSQNTDIIEGELSRPQ